MNEYDFGFQARTQIALRLDVPVVEFNNFNDHLEVGRNYVGFNIIGNTMNDIDRILNRVLMSLRTDGIHNFICCYEITRPHRHNDTDTITVDYILEVN